MDPTPRSGVRYATLAQVACVVASALFVWFYAVLPRLVYQTSGSLIGESLYYVTVAWFCGGLVTFCVYLVVSLADFPDVLRFSVRSSAPAMWFAPAFILLSARVPAAFAVSLVIVVNATRLLVSQWAGMQAPVSISLTLPWPSVLAGAFMAQAGVVAMLWHSPMVSAACIAASAAIITSLALVAGAYRPDRPPSLPPSILSVVVTFLLAATISVGGMVVRRGGDATEGRPASTPQSVGQPSTVIVTKTVAPPRESAEIGDGFPGVVLLPPEQLHTTIFVPQPSVSRMPGAPLKEPLGISFSGEYWMFKPPRTRPPLTSIVRRGKPSEIAFHTVDDAVMEMEAHQKLEEPIDIRCCRSVELMITNTDGYPTMITIELILLQSEVSGGRWASLGSQTPGAAIRQTLSYAVPPGIALDKFDEFKVIFHRSLLRAGKSARIAIERFVLAP